MNHLKEEGSIHDFASKIITTGRIALKKGGAVFLFGLGNPV